MKVTLKYLGMDSWDRPVYEDENGTLWKDTSPGRIFGPHLCTSVDNTFDGEPDMPMQDGAEVVFVPERVVWY